MNKRAHTLFSLILIAAWLLSACTSPAATTEAPQPAAETQPTQVVESPAATAPAQANQDLILSTTTSTEDSGLLEFLLPDFEQQFGVRINVIAVGTGQALQLGQDGNADVLLVHARAREDEFMADGHGVRREDVMYNDFVVLGPESDPAGIKGMTSAADAFKVIAEKQAIFISRGDDSGTHTKEKSIWTKAEIEPSGDWYVSAGQGMGEVITMAEEQEGYTLSDRATYLARTLQGLKLVVVVEGDKTLFNPYGVIAVNPDKNPNIKNDLANQFIDWIISVPVQEKIASFGKDEFGQSLFIPSSKPWQDAHTSVEPAAVTALKVSGLVDNELAWSEAEVKAMPTATAQGKDNKGAADNYSGVLISALLELAAPKTEAKTVVFVGDGETVEVDLVDVQACEDCLATFRNNGGFSLLIPFKSDQLAIKGLKEIQVK